MFARNSSPMKPKTSWTRTMVNIKTTSKRTSISAGFNRRPTNLSKKCEESLKNKSMCSIYGFIRVIKFHQGVGWRFDS